MSIKSGTESNSAAFRDCFSAELLKRIATGGFRRPDHISVKGKRKPKVRVAEGNPVEFNANELVDFIEYLASEIIAVLPVELQSLSYSKVFENPGLAQKYLPDSSPSALEDLLLQVPPDVTESLSTYGLLPPGTSFPPLFAAALTQYIETVAAPPPVWANTRASACEICERDWVRLTYHHLIPKQVHDKVLKRKWHEPWRLNSVAWLCRACHDFVHRIASNEELARELWSVDRLMARDDVRAWAAWVGRIRWKHR